MTEEKGKRKEKKSIKEKVQEQPQKEEVKPVEEKKEEVKPAAEEKKVKEGKEKPKRSEAIVKGVNIPISTKEAAAVCKFIKYKKIEKAISDLQEVIIQKKAIPMKGEIPHRKGRIMSGRYPQKSSKYFIQLLKSLNANANANNLENPVIKEAFANIGSRPHGRFGRIRRKRTLITIIVKEKKLENKEKK